MNQTRESSEQRMLVMALMMMTAGCMGAYTYLVRGGVFCNAQTGNLLLMGLSLGGESGLKGALYYFIPFAAYMGGTIVSEILSPRITPKFGMHWPALFTLIEILVFLIVGLVPKSVPNSIIQCVIMFTAACQYNSFQKGGSIPMATTFCTNHVRQLSIFLFRWTKTRDAASRRRVVTHLAMIACFVFGAMMISIFDEQLAEKTIWLAIVPAAAAAVFMIRQDIQEQNLPQKS